MLTPSFVARKAAVLAQDGDVDALLALKADTETAASLLEQGGPRLPGASAAGLRRVAEQIPTVIEKMTSGEINFVVRLGVADLAAA